MEKLDAYLREEGADYRLYHHEETFKSAAEGAKLFGISMSQTTPTLILKAKDRFYAAIICGNTRISFKKLKEALNLPDITMEDPQTVLKLTGANIGEVGLINEGMTTLIDREVLKNPDCYGGCGVPKATLRINTADLIRITKGEVLEFTDPR